jgi:hypothetical protein
VKSKPTEVISLDFSAYDERKIVVSDDDESDDESDADDEESDSCDSSVSSEEFDQIDELDISEVIQVDCGEKEPIVDMDMNIAMSSELEQVDEEIQVFDKSSERENESTEEKKETLPSVDQLKKMSINQLKTVASQVGVTTDVSKMKKPELISVIQAVL